MRDLISEVLDPGDVGADESKTELEIDLLHSDNVSYQQRSKSVFACVRGSIIPGQCFSHLCHKSVGRGRARR